MKLEAVFFDFDGVICDSVNIKTQAFAEIYKEYGNEVKEKVIEYHIEHGGESRYEKFKFWHKEYLKVDLSEKQLNELSEQFSNLVYNKILNADYIDGAIKTLKELQLNSISAYVISATPENEIREIISKKDLGSYFKGVYGSPKTKDLIVKELLKMESFNSSKCLFIGDAISDLKAAEDNHVGFLGIVHEYNRHIFPKHVRVTNSVKIPNDFMGV
jgi:phosphoglycolate phosphatase-like HAD superfamily hydrolase